MKILKWAATASGLAGLIIAVVLVVLSTQDHKPSTGFNLALALGVLLVLGGAQLWAVYHVQRIIERRFDAIQRSVDTHIEQGLTLVRAQAGLTSLMERDSGVTRLPHAR